MNRKRIAFGIGIGVLVLAVFTASAAAENAVYFDPDPSCAGPGEQTTVTLWADTTDGCAMFQADIRYDPNVVTVISGSAGDFPDMFTFDIHPDWDPPVIRTMGMTPTGYNHPPGHWKLIDNIVLEANATCSGTNTFSYPGTLGIHYGLADELIEMLPDQVWNNGTFLCLEEPEEYSGYLTAGWNLVSLPLTPENNSTSAVLGNDTFEYDAVYRYNAETKQFEDVTTGTMGTGTGYFVNVTSAGMWNYSGTAYTSMSVSLKQGLNLVGWLNCSKSISGNLTSIDGNYYYIASWNTTAALPSFETFNPVAPDVFNDFDEMKRGEGYFISMKTDGDTLKGGC